MFRPPLTLVLHSSRLGRLPVHLASHEHWRQIQFRPFLVRSSRLRSRCIVHSSPRFFICVGKLRVLQHSGVSAHEARVHHLGKFCYPPFISFKGSQPRGLYYGVCSDQHPSNQREFRDIFWQFLLVTPAFRFFSQFVICCSQSRSSCNFAVRLIIGP